jgi:alpha-galactosidase
MLVAFCTLVALEALPNGVGRVPVMGYNSWYDLNAGPQFNETTLQHIADEMVSMGLVDAGWRYLNLDDGFVAPQIKPNATIIKPNATIISIGHPPPPVHGGRLPNGSLYADPSKFPSGLRHLSDYLHAKNMLFGESCLPVYAMTWCMTDRTVAAGVYTARGRLTCAGRAGSLNHEAEDARRIAHDWQADYVSALIIREQPLLTQVPSALCIP